MGLAEHAKSAILVNVNTDEILFSKNPHEKLAPASMTKIMTLLIVMERLQLGQIKENDLVNISEYAVAIRGSRIFLRSGEVMQLKDLLKGIVIASGNDAAIAVAEHIAGTEARFVKLMNNKVSELGLRNTYFINSHGMNHKNHYSCAYDMYIMTKALLEFKEILSLSSLKDTTIQRKNRKRLLLKNTNTLLGKYPGVDGLKTGTTLKAGYCLAITAKREGTRVIAIVMGEPTAELRDRELIEMLNSSLPIS